jgi:hypothetical protein
VNWTDRTWIKQMTRRCSFCGLVRDGGVSGPGTGTGVHICPDCIRTLHQMLGGPPQSSDSAGAEEGLGDETTGPGGGSSRRGP